MPRYGYKPLFHPARGLLHRRRNSRRVQTDNGIRVLLLPEKVPDKPFSPQEIPEDEDYKNYLNPESLVVKTAYLEPSLATAEPGFHCQFERVGYFCADAKDHVPGEKAVYNRTVALKDSWAKIAAK